MPLSRRRPDDHLRRLDPAWYRGRAAVHWTMATDDRRTGWLSPNHHLEVRELLLHTLHRYQLICPVYCLMPDHGHFLWMGIDEGELSDQLAAARFFRRSWNERLKETGHRLQKQAYDHVLREDELRQDAFENACRYIIENPLRAGLEPNQGAAEDLWPYLGALVPGYPRLSPREEDFWPRFWKIRLLLMERGE